MFENKEKNRRNSKWKTKEKINEIKEKAEKISG